ncbi:hypothetical protein VTN77DRAFT_1516 [Rasamsonia byssochlamydoides]|uniref:uncharacterized protein n=1 Tax=Rasamsonia byssochlamydoides TaxID=89139 RepID=UPI003743B71D
MPKSYHSTEQGRQETGQVPKAGAGATPKYWEEVLYRGESQSSGLGLGPPVTKEKERRELHFHIVSPSLVDKSMQGHGQQPGSRILLPLSMTLISSPVPRYTHSDAGYFNTSFRRPGSDRIGKNISVHGLPTERDCPLFPTAWLHSRLEIVMRRTPIDAYKALENQINNKLQKITDELKTLTGKPRVDKEAELDEAKQEANALKTNYDKAKVIMSADKEAHPIFVKEIDLQKIDWLQSICLKLRSELAELSSARTS